MKTITTIAMMFALFGSMTMFAQGKPKAKPKTTNTTNNSSTTNKTTGTTSSPNVVVPPPANTNGNSTTNNNNNTATPPSNSTQKNTATPTVGGTNNKLGGTTTSETPVVLSPEEEARLVCSPISMGYTAFETLKSNVSAIASDSMKIETIKTEVQGKQVSVAQVRSLLGILQKDVTRLDLAKYLTDYTCNRSKYSTLSDMLVQDHVQEFSDFIKTKDMNDNAGGLVRDGN